MFIFEAAFLKSFHPLGDTTHARTKVHENTRFRQDFQAVVEMWGK